jgi:uncharacterized protein
MGMMNSQIERFLQEVADLPGFHGISIEGLNTHSDFGDTPLHVAAIRGDAAMIEALLNAGAQIDAAGEHQYTPLHEAVEQGHIEAVQLLLSRGASLTSQTDDGATPLELARSMGHRDIEILLRDSPDRT